ncbi:YjbH domain-containing protein [Arenibaculum sp.]|jgi:hypothetical protein|uniref:YjbH domain-containing protein n=1 Tax=Arenibaculum sp. TaxID=2865862 RepID=UPI002E0EED4A|nr:YjbH domain-containing protein [Arenibaculum sp.]
MSGLPRTIASTALLLALLLPATVPAAERDGVSGELIRTPTARQLEPGLAAAGAVIAGDMRAGYLTVVPFQGVAATLRRLELSDRSVAATADLELIVAREGRSGPQVAIGMRGLLGASDAAPYVVLGRRWWDLDFSLGVGGGRFADLDGILLPWSGQVVAPFGGVAWQPFGPALSFEAEYDPRGIAPAASGGRGGRGRLPLNLGLSWRPLRWLDLSAALVRGERAEMRVALLLQPPPERRAGPLRPQAPVRPGGSAPASAERRIARALTEYGMPATAVRVEARGAAPRTMVWLDRLPDGPPARTVGRVARVLAREAPPAVEWLTIVLQPEGLDGTSVSLMRRDVERAAAARGSPAEIWRNAEIGPVTEDAPAPASRWAFALTQRTRVDPASTGSRVPDLLAADLSGRWRSGPWLMAGEVRFDMRSREPGLNALYGGWTGSPGGGWHLRYSSGILEETFAGHSAEALYRPAGARWAAGLQADLVFERLPGSVAVTDRPFLSTIASAYLETPDAQGYVAVHAGRYLAGDPGFTVELSRILPRGLRLDAHATLTQATQGRRGAVFGLNLTVPFGRADPLPLDVSAELTLGPATVGAGRRLDQPLPLYRMTGEGSYGRIVASWPRILD